MKWQRRLGYQAWIIWVLGSQVWMKLLKKSGLDRVGMLSKSAELDPGEGIISKGFGTTWLLKVVHGTGCVVLGVKW